MIISNWHIAVFPKPRVSIPWSTGVLGGNAFKKLEIDSVQLDAVFEASFDQLFQKLESFERLFIELDGSFVWRGEHENKNWQVDGIVYEKDDFVWNIELKGYCDERAFIELIHSVTDQPEETVVQSISDAVVVPMSEFIRMNWKK